MKYIVDIKGEIEGDYEIISKYEERPQGECDKEHGELKDVDEITKAICKFYNVDCVERLPKDIKDFYEKFISSAPTIIEATFEYKLKNYACVKRG